MVKLNKITHLIFDPGNRLSQRTVHAGFWAIILKISDRGLSLIRTIILARLLSPEDFGLLGIALVSISALLSFSQTGFIDALIQKSDDIKPYLDTAWTIQVIRGIIIAIILFFGAPIVAWFFREPRSVMLLRILGLSQLAKGFVNIGVVFFRKNLEFHKHFVFNFSGTLTNLVVAIPSAIIFRSVWALVFGFLAGDLAMLLSSYILSPVRPHFRLSWSLTKELFSYGGWLFGVSILAYLGAQGDRIIIGRLIGTTALGLYMVGWQLVRAPIFEFSKGVIGTVAFPALSAVQTDNCRLRNFFSSMMETNLLVVLPITAAFVLFTNPLISLLLGQKWISLVPIIKLLSVAALLQGIREIDIRLYMAVGSPKFVFWFSFGRALLSVTLAMLLIPIIGLSGAAVAVLITSFILFGFAVRISSYKLGLKPYQYLRIFLPILFATGISLILTVIVLRTVSFSPTNWIQLLVAITIFFVIYSTSVFIELRIGWLKRFSKIFSVIGIE